MKQLTVKAVIGSWKAYNECSARSLGSQELDLSKFNSVNEISKVKYFDGIINAKILPQLTTKDIDMIKKMTKGNVSEKEHFNLY